MGVRSGEPSRQKGQTVHRRVLWGKYVLRVLEGRKGGYVWSGDRG